MKRLKKIVTAVLAAASVLLIILGILGGEPAEVYQKAMTICLECIGVG